MKPGNTINAYKLPPVGDMQSEEPLKLPGNSSDCAIFHVIVGVFGGLAGLPLCAYLSINCWDVWETSRYFVPALVLLCVWSFCRHNSKVCAWQLRATERGRRHSRRGVATFLTLLVFPVLLPVLVVQCCRYFADVLVSWESFFSYESIGVQNPGVLRDPGGPRWCRIALFHLSIWFSGAALHTVPVDGDTGMVMLQMWWGFFPAHFGPPIALLVFASLVLSSTVHELSEDSSER